MGTRVGVVAASSDVIRLLPAKTSVSCACAPARLRSRKITFCPPNRTYVRIQTQDEKDFLHWDRNILDKEGDDDTLDELPAKICITDDTFVCVPGTHTKAFRDKFRSKYGPLYLNVKKNAAKFSIDPERDPLGLFQEQRAFDVPWGHWICWKKDLLHGHLPVPRNESMRMGFYIGFKLKISNSEQKECEKLYRDGAMPRLYPSGDRVWFQYDAQYVCVYYCRTYDKASTSKN